MQQFRVELDRSNCVYFPGGIVSGTVRFHLNSPLNIRGLIVECVGKSTVYWSESEMKGRTTEIIHYQACENYCQQQAQLSGDVGEVEPAEYEYKFQFQLAQQLPTSFEGVYGYVRYHVRARLDRGASAPIVFKRGFTVNNIVDLNADPRAAKSVRNEESKTLCCWCCRSGPITVSCWLPKSGYVPGERIIFCGQIENQSASPLHSTTVQLVEKTVFKAQGKTKENSRVVGDITRNKSDNEDLSDVWDHIPIVMPSLAPSGLDKCTIIELSYVLQFVANPGTFSFNLMVPLDIIVGSVPLRNSFPSFVGYHDDNKHPADDDMGLLRLEKYPNLPSQTYEYCFFGGELKEDEDPEDLNDGFKTSFFPQYITYTSTSTNVVV